MSEWSSPSCHTHGYRWPTHTVGVRSVSMGAAIFRSLRRSSAQAHEPSVVSALMIWSASAWSKVKCASVTMSTTPGLRTKGRDGSIFSPGSRVRASLSSVRPDLPLLFARARRCPGRDRSHGRGRQFESAIAHVTGHFSGVVVGRRLRPSRGYRASTWQFAAASVRFGRGQRSFPGASISSRDGGRRFRTIRQQGSSERWLLDTTQQLTNCAPDRSSWTCRRRSLRCRGLRVVFAPPTRSAARCRWLSELAALCRCNIASGASECESRRRSRLIVRCDRERIANSCEGFRDSHPTINTKLATQLRAEAFRSAIAVCAETLRQIPHVGDIHTIYR